MIRDVYFGSRIRIFSHPGSRDQDPGVKRELDPESATLIKTKKFLDRLLSHIFRLQAVVHKNVRPLCLILLLLKVSPYRGHTMQGRWARPSCLFFYLSDGT